MKILFVEDSINSWQSGIWFHRTHIPSLGLKKRGHATSYIALMPFDKIEDVPDRILNWPDTVIFGRTYPTQLNPVALMREYKRRGKRVLYDVDDDLWTVSKDNPSALVSTVHKDQYEDMIRFCDAFITPSKVLAKKIQKISKKPVFMCHNAINYEIYPPRKNKKPLGKLNIGYSGAASHWKDLQIVTEALVSLSKKYDFNFTLYGLTSGPLEGEIYNYDQVLKRNLQPEKNDYFQSALDFYGGLKKDINLVHIPFYPPELHPVVLARADFDIGIIPLEDTEFNKGKSCIKFYEYNAVETVTLASKVIPYKDEVGYCAKNNVKDWYNKLEKLIVDKEFRKKLLKKQTDWVKNNRDIDKIALNWELACQKPGGLPVMAQQQNEDIIEKP